MYRNVFLITVGLFISAAAAPTAARACGGGFGAGLNIDPSQKIVVALKDGAESYIFNPHFCGTAANFGLILPVPATLTSNPALVDGQLFEQLEALTAPTIIEKVACEGERNYGAADAGAGNAPDARQPPVQVIDRGQVGIFDWALLKADTPAAFTDWLEANNFPYDTKSTAAFSHYVSAGWHFVAFKVTADEKAPPAGSQLCGDFGPLSLAFKASELVVPARIATAGGHSWQFGWRVFAIAESQQKSTNNNVSGELRYSGSLTAEQLTTYPEIAKLTAAGARLTKLDLSFWGSELTSDIVLTKDAAETDFRQTVTRTTYVPCGEGGGPVADAGGTVLPPRDAMGPASTDAGKLAPRNNGDSGCAVANRADDNLALAWLTLLCALGLLRRRRTRRGKSPR